MQIAKNPIFVIILISLSWLLLILIFKHLSPYISNLENLSTIVNSLFAALAFGGIILTIYLQQKELSLQREELTSTRREFELQNQTLRKQRFENTFFNLIGLHHQIVNQIQLNEIGHVYEGRDAIKMIHQGFVTKFREILGDRGNPVLEHGTVDIHKRITIEAFTKNYNQYEEHISYYLRNFAALTKFTHASDLIAESEKDFYYSIIKSQLNSYEVALHFYNFNAGYGSAHKDLFDALTLATIMHSDRLAFISHSFLFDPPFVVKAALCAK